MIWSPSLQKMSDFASNWISSCCSSNTYKEKFCKILALYNLSPTVSSQLLIWNSERYHKSNLSWPLSATYFFPNTLLNTSLYTSLTAQRLPYIFLLAVVFLPDWTRSYHQLDINCKFGMCHSSLNVSSSENTARTNQLFIRDHIGAGTNSHCCFALEVEDTTTKDYPHVLCAYHNAHLPWNLSKGE